MTGRFVEFSDLVDIIAKRGRSARSITAVAGPPGGGKSTLAEALVDALNRAEPGSAAILPMDGYHFDDMVLVPRGFRPRKGAPHTFDVAGFAHMLDRLRKNDEEEIAVPVFDRSIEIARAGARMIGRPVRHLIVEGLYLLLDQDPWRSLAPLYDTTVFIELPFDEVRRRLESRWGGMTPAEMKEKMEGNDLPNARLVVSKSRPAEFVIDGLKSLPA